jgi:hypothetical protein
MERSVAGLGTYPTGHVSRLRNLRWAQPLCLRVLGWKGTKVPNSQAHETPITGAMLAMTAASFERCDLADREIMMVRIAALAASGAPAISYAANTEAAAVSGLTIEDAQGILVAILPIIGTARTVAATEAIAEGLGIAVVAALDAED